MTIATLLDQALRTAGIPIIGVKVGDERDRGTWSIQFAEEATAQQRASGAALVASIVADAAALANADLDLRLSADKVFRATVIWMAGKLNVTPQQARTEIVAIFKQL